jgi:hypothetical protein
MGQWGYLRYLYTATATHGVLRIVMLQRCDSSQMIFLKMMMCRKYVGRNVSVQMSEIRRSGCRKYVGRNVSVIAYGFFEETGDGISD